MSKVDQKRNWVKLKSVQTLLRIACLANRKSYVVIIYMPMHVKVYQKRNWVKLKSVQTLLRITCLADRKSYVVIICANACENLPKAKLGQVEVCSNIAQNHWKSYVVIICANSVKSLPKVKIGSNIYQNGFCSRYEVICCHYLCQLMWKVYQKWNLFNYCSKSFPYFPI